MSPRNVDDPCNHPEFSINLSNPGRCRVQENFVDLNRCGGGDGLILHLRKSVITIMVVLMSMISCTRWEIGIQLYPR